MAVDMYKFGVQGRDSSGGITTGFGLGDRGSIRAGKHFYLLHSVQTGSEAHPSNGYGGFFPRSKAARE
jgi:hypothetical protein